MTNKRKLLLLFNWLFLEPIYVWGICLPIFVAFYLSFIVYQNEQTIRISGLILQLFGDIAVIIGVYKTWKFFGMPSIGIVFRNWLRSYPLKVREVTGQLSGTLDGISVIGRGTVTHQPKENATIEERIESLEKNIEYINNRISGYQNEIDRKLLEFKNDFREEQQDRLAKDKSIEELIRSSSTNGLSLSIMGAILLFVGLILGTASNEIVALLR